MIFISYRISDSLDIVGRLDADLAREFGAEVVFRDKSRLRGGHDWTRELETNAKSRRIMLVVIGDTWQTTSFTDGDWKGMPRLMDDEDWVRKEITFALDAGNIIIPVFLTGGTMPSEGWLKKCKLERLFKKHGEHLRSVDYVADFANLVRVLREQCPDLPKGPGGPTLPIRKNMPQPPDVYAVPNYILTSTFIGRATELDELDAWADSNDPVMVVEGI
ncbi:MAG TPA: toll/interleukin-1 receptor domain-containing protein, partial [Gemmataceae bacterium]|nr:toll/interleukin-1 receptor domain-containing protein [Gemmataceae bacterium]